MKLPSGLRVTLAAIGVAAAFMTSVAGQHGSTDGEWRFYGGDAGSTRYSPLSEINKDNVKDLRIAWRWKTENLGPRPDFNYEVTPLMAKGVLYTSAGWRRDIAAIDPATGETLWLFRYPEGTRGDIAPALSAAGRGLAYWTGGNDERIIYVTRGYRMISLDAKTGKPSPGFGKDGVVDLYDDFEQAVQDGQLSWNSPPMIVKDVVVVGYASPSGAPKSERFPVGHVRGYDVRTGKRLWIFHTIPRPGEFGNDTWENDSWSYTGHATVWGLMSADEELGYVYLPIDTPTNDFYGGYRPGSGLFGETLVCLDARTGKRVWHFQTVHHGIWDYDLTSAPNLLDITVNGRRIKAVAQVSKQAFTYVFDRVTGVPVWPIEERPVAQSTVPGEKTWPTQPFPTKPAPFDRQGVTLDDLVDFTPELNAEARRVASQYKLGPLYTPASVEGADGLKGTLMLPNADGGANWQGAAVDPETGILYVPSFTAPSVIYATHDPQRSTMRYIGGRAVSFLQISKAIPLVKPPWGRITAIDLNTGDHRWMVPNADTPEQVTNDPALKGVQIPPTGKPDRGGILVTKTLLFAGEGSGMVGTPPIAGGPMFRVYDKQTGALVFQYKLPASQTGNPMTYSVGNKQYIVVAVGGRNYPGELVALTLP